MFLSVLLAELGDKTQLATLLFAANPAVKAPGVFLAAAGALVVSTAVAVTVGAQIGTTVSARVLKTIAGIGFLLIGLWDADRPVLTRLVECVKGAGHAAPPPGGRSVDVYADS